MAPVREMRAPQANPDGVTFMTEVGPVSVTVYARDMFRIRLGDPTAPFYGLLELPPVTDPAELGGAVQAVRTNSGWTVSAGGTTLVLDADPLRIAFRRGGQYVTGTASDAHFVREHRLPAFSRIDGGWFAALSLDSGEPVYGLGEKWGPLNRRGQLVVSWAEDALGVNAEASYKNCPFAWSPKGWGMFVHTPGRVTHGVGYPQWSQRAYGLAVEDEVLDLFFFVGDSPADLLERYTALTGRMPMPPLWSLGVWLSQAYYRTADELLAAADATREKQMPCDVIVLDGRAWLDTDTRFAFEWDASRYPDPKAVTDRIHDRDLRLCCWEYPLVSVKHPLFAEMEDKGWLLKDPETGRAYRHVWDPAPFGKVLTPLPESGIVDFTHPAAYAYWRDRHAGLFRSGVDVIKTDFGEQVPENAVAHNGDTGRRLHNVYPLLYNRCVFEATEDYFARAGKPGQGLVLGRSGWAGSQRYPLQWGGDPQADWEGLAASLRGGMSWGLSGAPCYATDIGGFYGPQPGSELFIRWTEAAVFSSHMRFHGIGPRHPWDFGDEALAIIRRFLELRYRLIPYLRGVLAEAAETGVPCMRAMVLACPDDPAAWAFDLQYMFGPDLLVAPVVRSDGAVTLYLPHGDWYDFWTGEKATGGRVIKGVMPLDRIPLYVRMGAVLPLGPAVEHTGELEGRNPVERLTIYGEARFAPCLEGRPVGVRQGALTTVPDGTAVDQVGGD
ncbi:MAG: TIM-barrel domain-containing protein [Inquilinaceae bacterium]